VLSADHKGQFPQVPEVEIDHGVCPCLISGIGSWQLGRNDDYSVVMQSQLTGRHAYTFDYQSVLRSADARSPYRGVTLG
jgi:cytochrome oxidase assembly protein ShyY1